MVAMHGRLMLPALMLALAIAPATAGCVGCATGLYEGVLTEQAGDLVVVPEGGGRGERVKWPSGYGVHKDGDALVIADFFGSVKARRSGRRQASFRMWMQARRCLAALLSQKETSSDKLPRSRRWQRERDKAARAVL